MSTIINPNTSKADGIRADLARAGAGVTIWDAYGRPSNRKVRAYLDIKARAEQTDGYNGDLHITGAGSSFFSTVYSYTDADGRHIIKDTPSNTYEVIDR